jgi:hypothetical protein
MLLQSNDYQFIIKSKLYYRKDTERLKNKCFSFGIKEHKKKELSNAFSSPNSSLMLGYSDSNQE